VPAPNGLIPQAPIHTTSLVVMGRSPKYEKDEEDRPSSHQPSRPSSHISRNSGENAINNSQPPSDRNNDASGLLEVPVGVVEQRMSNLAQGSLCLVLLTGPFLHVLNLIPRGVLAGLLYVPTLYLVLPPHAIDETLFSAGTWALMLFRAMESRRKSST
jgi:hypothetical protein